MALMKHVVHVIVSAMFMITSAVIAFDILSNKNVGFWHCHVAYTDDLTLRSWLCEHYADAYLHWVSSGFTASTDIGVRTPMERPTTTRKLLGSSGLRTTARSVTLWQTYHKLRLCIDSG